MKAREGRGQHRLACATGLVCVWRTRRSRPDDGLLNIPSRRCSATVRVGSDWHPELGWARWRMTPIFVSNAATVAAQGKGGSLCERGRGIVSIWVSERFACRTQVARHGTRCEGTTGRQPDVDRSRVGRWRLQAPATMYRRCSLWLLCLCV